MKEMCRNFVCNNRCQQKSVNTPSAAATQSTTILPDAFTGDCSSCVMEKIGLAQAYVPSQPYTQPMEQEQSLVCGTTFTELVMPYCSGWNLHRYMKEV